MAPSGRKGKKEGSEGLGMSNIFSHALMSVEYEDLLKIC